MPERPPNILLVLAHQLVPFLTGAYGQPVVRTPSLDRLAAEGIRFDAAYLDVTPSNRTRWDDSPVFDATAQYVR